MRLSQYILVLGSNRGDREYFLEKAKELLSPNAGHILKSTVSIETPPYIVHNQPPFINTGVLLESSLTPQELLDRIKQIEEQVGRTRSYRYGPREIDIDIVWWSEGHYRGAKITIPHEHNNARPWVREVISSLCPSDHPDYKVYKKMNVKEIKTVFDFYNKKKSKEKIAMVTVYDYTSAKILSRTSVDTVLVGDSLGNVINGYTSTIPVTLENMIYHASAVRKGMPDAFITVDMPFLTYQVSTEEAVINAGKIIQQTQVQAVKVEGGAHLAPVIEALKKASIPVMGHIGLQPQSVLLTGGPKLQAKKKEDLEKLINDAKALEKAGVFAIVLEMVPASVGKAISEAVEVPIIGIGAGPYTDGQVLVFHDLLGYDPDFAPRFVRKYANLADEIKNAVENYSADVRTGDFPSKSEYFE